MGFFYDGMSVQNKRSTNMDSVLVREKELEGTPIYIAAVCDGVGSMADGAVASSAAIRMLNDWFEQVTDARRMGLQLRDCVIEINSKISEAARNAGLRTASTLSALLIDGERYYIVHTGDSRVYSIGNGALRQLTQDQVLDGKLFSCLGRGEKMTLLYNEGFLTGEAFLLCSDGLYKRVDTRELCAELSGVGRKRLRKSMERLVQSAIDQGERDNISLAVLIYES